MITFPIFNKHTCVVVFLLITIGYSQESNNAGGAEIFSDSSIGCQLVLTQGWTNITRPKDLESTIIKARLWHAPSNSDCYFVSEFLPGGFIPTNNRPLDTYLDYYSLSQKRIHPDIKEISRKDFSLKGRSAKRLIDTYTFQRERFLLFTSICREGYQYFALESTCAVGDSMKCIDGHAELWKNMRITKTEREQFSEIVSALIRVPPFCYVDSATILLATDTILKTLKSASMATQAANQIVQKGIDLLPASDKEDYNRIIDVALAQLDDKEKTTLASLSTKMTSGIFTPSEKEQTIVLLKKMYDGLPEIEMNRFRSILKRAIKLALAKKQIFR